jgi:hypothetical protein
MMRILPTPGTRWDVATRFCALRQALDTQRSWARARALASRWRALAESSYETLQRTRVEWDRRLELLGGDPSNRDWLSFRPLRLEREEAWSDWLAFLLASSGTGEFATHLLGPDAIGDLGAYRAASAIREQPVLDGDRRADVVVLWNDARGTHLELKLWDQSFSKTFDTARGVEQQFPKATCWTHFVVHPEESMPTWERTKEEELQRGAGTPQIQSVTWHRVALALRRSLTCSGEDGAWKAWAYSFCGAIEQRILGFPQFVRPFPPASSLRHSQLQSLTSMSAHLEEGSR